MDFSSTGMEVVIYCTLPEHEGRYTLQVEPNYTIQRVIKSFCSENEIKFKSSYVLKSRSQDTFSKKQQLSCLGIQEGDEFYICIQDDGQWGCGCNQWWVLVFVCLAIGCCGIVVVSVLQSLNYDPVYSYGIGIDAGSSHTKLYVYRWLTGKSNGTGIVEEIFVCPSSEGLMPPLSAFVGNESEAGKQCVKPCLDKAQGFVPSREHSNTPVLLGATAGMRILRLSDNASAEAIMSSVRETMASYKFLFVRPEQQARIIEGSEEGAFSWVTTNYLSGTFGFFPLSPVSSSRSISSGLMSLTPTIGALDMGGASTQITFQPESPHTIADGYNDTVVLYGYNYRIYTYSYLCYGLNEAYRRHLAQLVKSAVDRNTSIAEPCRPSNYSFQLPYSYIFKVPCTLNAGDPTPSDQSKNVTFYGTSDTTRCQELTLQLLNKTVPCKTHPCTFDGVYQPPLYDNFLAFSGYYYTLNFLNLTKNPNFTLSDFEFARDSHCNQSYSQILQLRQTRFLLSRCFNSHFIYNLLVNGYGFNDSNWKSIQFQNKVNGVELGWTLGMMINVTNIIPTLSKVEMIALPVFIILVILFVIFLLLAIAFNIQARRRSRHKYRTLPTNENV